MTAHERVEYRIEHLRDRMAREDLAELGVRVEARGSGAVISGSVSSPECRAEVLRLAAEELAGLEWREDITISRSAPPGRAEELS
ncbi:hypothetical protein ABZZ17_07175 [Streptomyces sp. NPDC006512]|uniref:hypothetical protein n=1 Tax=Streptomyces sp. NPDC006512 TaxID=3154307 RepID=UPI0033AC2BFA